MLEAKTNPRLGVFSNIKCLLELGVWTVESINELLKKANYLFADSSERLHHILGHFVGVKFSFESRSPDLPLDYLRVRLEYMDCATYIYNILALSKSSNFDEYVLNLYKIRYLSSSNFLINSDSDTGNIFDFIYESLIMNGTKIGLLMDITNEIAGSDKNLIEVSVHLKRFQRPSMFDKNKKFVTPRFGERVVSDKFIPSESLGKINKKPLKNGDLILFTSGSQKNGIASPVLISHLAFVHKEDEEIFFYHATKHFNFRSDATELSPSEFTGVFLDRERKKEIIGTGIAGIFAGEETRTECDGVIYFGMNQAIKRPLKEYAMNTFRGVKFLRVL